MDSFLADNRHMLFAGRQNYASGDDASDDEDFSSDCSFDEADETLDRVTSSTPMMAQGLLEGVLKSSESLAPTDIDQMSTFTTSTVSGRTKTSLNLNDHYTVKFVLDENSGVMCTKFHGRRLFVALASGTVRVYTASSIGVTCQYILEDDDTYKNSVTSMTFLEQPKQNAFKMTAQGGFYKEISEEQGELVLVVSYVSGVIKLWHVTTRQCLSTIKEKDSESLTCTVSNDKKYLYSAGDHDPTLTRPFSINQYDLETKKLITQFTPSVKTSTENTFIDGHVRRIFALKMNPEYDHLFISAGWDDTIQFWDERTQHSIRRIPGPHVCSESGLDISPDGHEILAGSWRRFDNLQRFDFGSGKLVKNYELPPRHPPVQPYSVKYLDQRTIGVGTSSENTFMTFDTMLSIKGKHDIPMTKISNLPGGVYSFDALVQDRHGILRDDNYSDVMSMRSTTTAATTAGQSNSYRLVALASDTKVFLVRQNKPLISG